MRMFTYILIYVDKIRQLPHGGLTNRRPLQ